MERVVNWEPVKEKFCNKLNAWKTSTLSMSGHLTLVKSILRSLPLYYFSLFCVSSIASTELEQIRTNFV